MCREIFEGTYDEMSQARLPRRTMTMNGDSLEDQEIGGERLKPEQAGGLILVMCECV